MNTNNKKKNKKKNKKNKKKNKKKNHKKNNKNNNKKNNKNNNNLNYKIAAFPTRNNSEAIFTNSFLNSRCPSTSTGVSSQLTFSL